MVVSVIIVAIVGVMKVGGIGNVLTLAAKGHRLDVDFTFDATTRITFWNITICSILSWTSYIGFNQSCVQRIVSLPTLQQAKHAILIFGIGFLFIMTFNCFTGIVMFARYHDCDPLLAGYVQKVDKMMPYFVQDTVGHLSGMPGVFISCVFSAALSTMSASLNSLSGIVYFDYIKPHIKHTEHRANVIMKGFVFISGIYCILAGAVVEKFTSILQMVYSINGVTFGAIFGVFLLGMLVPRAHGRAALIAVIISLLTMITIVIGAQGRLHYSMLPSSVEGCGAFNVTPSSSSILISPEDAENTHKSFSIFEMSFNWYITLGAGVVFIVGIPLSYILEPEKNIKYNPRLISPVIRSFLKYERTHMEEIPEIIKINENA